MGGCEHLTQQFAHAVVLGGVHDLWAVLPAVLIVNVLLFLFLGSACMWD